MKSAVFLRYGIHPKVDARCRVMSHRRYATDDIHRTSRGDSMPIIQIEQKKDRSETVFFLAPPTGIEPITNP